MDRPSYYLVGSGSDGLGQTFLRRATAVRNELQRAKEEIDQLRGQAHGTVTVCLSSVPHRALLPNALRPFRARFPEVALRVIDAVFPNVESSLQDGTVDCCIGPPPARMPTELRSEKLFDNTRVILGRKGHPLAKARSLRDLVDAEWITASITHRAEEELGPLFAENGLPPPRLVMRAQSSLTFLVSMAYSELLMMLPVQWIKYEHAGALARRLGMSDAGVRKLEKAEADDAITLASLRKLAAALECELHYALVPRVPLAQRLRDRATEVACERLRPVSHSMSLEDQSVQGDASDVQRELLARELLAGSRRELW